MLGIFINPHENFYFLELIRNSFVYSFIHTSVMQMQRKADVI